MVVISRLKLKAVFSFCVYIPIACDNLLELIRLRCRMDTFSLRLITIYVVHMGGLYAELLKGIQLCIKDQG